MAGSCTAESSFHSPLQRCEESPAGGQRAGFLIRTGSNARKTIVNEKNLQNKIISVRISAMGAGRPPIMNPCPHCGEPFKVERLCYARPQVPEESRESGAESVVIQRTYQALTGIEVATAGAKLATNLMLSIPGMNSRLTTFPRVKLTVTVRIEAYDRHPVELTDMNDPDRAAGTRRG